MFRSPEFCHDDNVRIRVSELTKKSHLASSVLALNDRKHNDKTYGQEMINTPQKRCYDIAR